MHSSQRSRSTSKIWSLVIVSLLTGCAVQGTAGSRHTIYEDLAALASDSQEIVWVRVDGQSAVGAEAAEKSGQSAHTLSVAQVLETWDGDGIGSVDSQQSRLGVGDQIAVRQMGTQSQEMEGELLGLGEEYLLFLTPTMIPDAPLHEFYVTGGMAGIYRVTLTTNGDAEFLRLYDEGDNLPWSIDRAQLAELLR